MPTFALAISLASLAIPVAVVFWLPDWTSNGLGMLIWLTALIPAFLLSYYRGLQGVAVALAGGMAVITATQVSIVMFDIAEPNWALLLGIVGIYLAISGGIAGLSEVLRRERTDAQSMALVDPLTGLPNRRHLELMLTAEFAAAERGATLSVVMFDLDLFKSVNDKHGHGAGDRTLQAFARVLRANTRRENLSARYGGEEFVSVLRNTNREDAKAFADRVLDQIRATQLPWGRQTVSAGIAEHEPGMGSYELLIGVADLALYRAKEAGRDCACSAPKAGDAPAAPLRQGEPEASAATVRVTADDTAPVMVWIVDDMAQVRSLLKAMLSDTGYASWDTGSPIEAIRRFAQLPPESRPDVILADVIMPEMSGIRMIEEITKVDANVGVIYMSGFVQSTISWGGSPGTDVAFLEKPIAMDKLFGAITSVLATKGGAKAPAA